MPPKKRARVSAAATPSTTPATPLTRPSAPLTHQQPPSPNTSSATAALLADPWTDEQQTALFKALVHHKPTGLHKHLRIVAIHLSLRSQGYAAPHTRIPGIWAKLRELYDLDALDERELLAQLGSTGLGAGSPTAAAAGDDDGDDGDNAPVEMREFGLPWEEFGGLIWERRFPGAPAEGSENGSPAVMPASLRARKGSVPPVGGAAAAAKARRERAESDRDGMTPTPSTAAAATPARGRGGRRGGRAARGGRGGRRGAAKAQAEARRAGMESESSGSEEQDDSEAESGGSSSSSGGSSSSEAEDDGKEDSSEPTATPSGRGRGGRGGRGRGGRRARGRRGRG